MQADIHITFHYIFVMLLSFTQLKSHAWSEKERRDNIYVRIYICTKIYVDTYAGRTSHLICSNLMIRSRLLNFRNFVKVSSFMLPLMLHLPITWDMSHRFDDILFKVNARYMGAGSSPCDYEQVRKCWLMWHTLLEMKCKTLPFILGIYQWRGWTINVAVSVKSPI